MKNIFLTVSLFLVSCSNGGLHVENDIFNPFQKNSDQYYTHGTQFDRYIESDKEQQTYSIGQLIYTPEHKHEDATPAQLAVDRPYTGWLYGEYRDSWLDSSSDKDTLGIQLGCTGPCSFAKQTQRQVHRWLQQKLPTWDRNYTLKSEPGFILEAEKERGLYENEFIQFKGGLNSKFGNIIDNIAGNLVLNTGYNIPSFTSDPIVFKLPERETPKISAYTFIKLEQRLVAYNHFLDGSLFQDERHTVDSRVSVEEFDAGISIGYGKYAFTYRYTLFTSEWVEKKGNFGFGGFDFKW